MERVDHRLTLVCEDYRLAIAVTHWNRGAERLEEAELIELRVNTSGIRDR